MGSLEGSTTLLRLGLCGQGVRAPREERRTRLPPVSNEPPCGTNVVCRLLPVSVRPARPLPPARSIRPLHPQDETVDLTYGSE
ncbi:MAG: hypothetical protein CMD83_11660 [Gammaproteobacteria bacterium]|nr:hypothetical protein [Gammaproteobacteria bacterium]